MSFVTRDFPLLRQTDAKNDVDPFVNLLNEMEGLGFAYLETYKPRPGKMVRKILFKYVGEGEQPAAKELPKTEKTAPKMPDSPAAKPGNDMEPVGDEEEEGDDDPDATKEPAADKVETDEKPKDTPKEKQPTGQKAKPAPRRRRRVAAKPKPADKPAVGDK